MSIRSDILERLQYKTTDDTTQHLVLAALSGPEEVEQVLSGKVVDRIPDPEATDEDKVPSAYLKSISVKGFRGIGPEATLDLKAQPGLTLVVGRNGSGKSSFFDALEVLLTGDSHRWKGKPAALKGGWRNYHVSTGTRVIARFVVEGISGETVVERNWQDLAKRVTDATQYAQHHGKRRTTLEGMGWTEPLELYRPLLSHPELEIIASRPSGLYDTLSKVLGLDELLTAHQVLAKARGVREKRSKEVQGRLAKEILPALQAIEDDRATAAFEVLSAEDWQLDDLHNILLERQMPSMQQLLDLTQITVPDFDEVVSEAGRVEIAVLALQEVTDTDVQRSSDLADLLQQAVEHHDRHGDEWCPVCGNGRMDTEWEASARCRIQELRTEASKYRTAVSNLKKRIADARRLVSPVQLPTEAPLDLSTLQKTWKMWGSLPDNPAEIPKHLVDQREAVAEAAQWVRRQAEEKYSSREALWRPVRESMLNWLPGARTAQDDQLATAILRDAERVLQELEDELRNTRWEPIEKESLQLWRSLRLQSSIDLESITLTGRGNRRAVDLKVKVDGREAAALGVASQGEINCLALSLFFPRGMLPESPFRFLVIDDPVQAMDPARVDGLARIFHQIGATHQLVVFTHDDRLPEALRRLRLPCHIKEVTRQPGSVVGIRDALDPVEQYFEDARALAMDKGIPTGIAAEAVPVICREGLEAACMERIRRVRIGRGERHLDVERKIEQANTLVPMAALALLEDTDKGPKVAAWIEQRWGRDLAETFRTCNKRVHEGYTGNVHILINQCTRLAKRIQGV